MTSNATDHDRSIQEHGTEAVSTEYSRYDQVEKPAYHLSEAADSADAFDEDFTFTTCDLGRYLHGNAADKAAFAGELGSAMRDIGFVILEGHGVDPALIKNAEDTIEEVFTSVTLEDKMRFPSRTTWRCQRGLLPG